MARKTAPTTYRDKLAVDAYILAKAGLSNMEVAKGLGTSEGTFLEWMKKHEALKYALEQARGGKDGTQATFKDYVYKRLPSNLQVLWDQIEFAWDSPSGYEKVQAMLAKESASIRQCLFMHAMVSTNFNASEACRMIGISKSIVERWNKEDPDFPALLNEINWHKKNFFERGLLKLVDEGHPLAVIFANRTYNRDRGYSEKVTVEHTGTINHNIIPLSKLNLPVEVLLQIEEAMKALPEAKPAGDNKDAIQLTA